MKYFYILAIGAFTIITSCQKSAVAPSTDKKPISSSQLQGKPISGTTSSDQKIELNLASFGVAQTSPCTAELLKIVSGTYHANVHTVINANKISVTQHGNTSDFKLVGMISGAPYNASVNSNQHQESSFTNGSSTIIITETTTVTSPGRGNNAVIKFDLHETFDANGNVTTTVDNMRTVCH
ncbi:MAG: hypothetical protein ACHQHN_06300 [Sphingobacteriales bacterium]